MSGRGHIGLTVIRNALVSIAVALTMPGCQDSPEAHATRSAESRQAQDHGTQVVAEADRKQASAVRWSDARKKHPEWSPEDWARLEDGRVWIGMNEDQLRLILLDAYDSDWAEGSACLHRTTMCDRATNDWFELTIDGLQRFKVHDPFLASRFRWGFRAIEGR